MQGLTPMRRAVQGVPPAACAVCGAAVRPAVFAGVARAAAGEYPCCDAVACRMVVSRRAGMSEAGFAHYLRLQAAQVRTRQVRAGVLDERIRLQRRENTAAWERLEATAPDLGAAVRLLLPSGPRRDRAVAARRRERYARNLYERLAEARRLPPEPPAPVNDTAQADGAAALPGRLCAMCAGGCCTRGGDHAYLDAAGLRALVERDPARSDDDIVAAYLERVPARHRAGSCINHTADGCALPREMRSPVCNAYACKALAEVLQAQRRGGGRVIALVVQRKQDNWQRGTMAGDDRIVALARVDEDGARRLRWRPAAAAAPAANDEPR